MKKLLVILLLLVPAAAFAQPKIAFDTTEYNFGEVKQGDVLEHTFTFSNEGTEALDIEKLSAT